jgi:hypothetical protein
MKPTTSDLMKALAALCAAGVVLAASCSPNQMRAIMVGFEAATDSLEGRDRSDINFSDWLMSELDDD